MQDPRASSPFLATNHSTIIIVSSVLFAFLCFCILALYVICKWGELRGRIFRSTQQINDGENGLSGEVVKALPVVNYQQLVQIKGAENIECCAVCLIEFVKGDKKIRHLPRCGHSFHSQCIDTWFFSHNSCPICRDSLSAPPHKSGV